MCWVGCGGDIKATHTPPRNPYPPHNALLTRTPVCHSSYCNSLFLLVSCVGVCVFILSDTLGRHIQAPTHPNIQAPTHPSTQASKHPHIHTSTHPNIHISTHPNIPSSASISAQKPHHYTHTRVSIFSINN